MEEVKSSKDGKTLLRCSKSYKGKFVIPLLLLFAMTASSQNMVNYYLQEIDTYGDDGVLKQVFDLDLPAGNNEIERRIREDFCKADIYSLKMGDTLKMQRSANCNKPKITMEELERDEADEPWYYYIRRVGNCNGVFTIESYDVFGGSGSRAYNGSYTYLNYDAETGERLSLSDIFKDTADKHLVKKVFSLCRLKTGKRYKMPEYVDLTDNFCMYKDYICFVYRQGEASCNADGVIMIRVPWRNIREYLTEKWRTKLLNK